jgi:hypothetical protein
MAHVHKNAPLILAEADNPSERLPVTQQRKD